MSDNRTVEIYSTFDVLEAENIKGILEEEGIPNEIRDLGISPYPLTIGTFNEKRIVVARSDAKEASGLIQKAITDRIISSNGEFIQTAE